MFFIIEIYQKSLSFSMLFHVEQRLRGKKKKEDEKKRK
jgi:hypothetical protein